MLTKEMRTLIMHELPEIIKQDEEIHQFIISLTSRQFANKQETESRFDRILDEMRREREAQEKKWAENQKQLAAQEKRWGENQKQLVVQEKRWGENQKQWEENQKTIQQILARLEKTDKRIDQSIGALGARWGLQAEEAFRNGLKAILEESFGVEVIHLTEWDDTGVVFGRPDQIELDLIIRNGQLIICEIKSSVSKSDAYSFERKVRFYEKVHNRTCHRMLIISPMLDTQAKTVAAQLGIEAYTHSGDVGL